MIETTCQNGPEKIELAADTIFGKSGVYVCTDGTRCSQKF